MTDAGEHGGASIHETDSGLFVYRKPQEGVRATVFSYSDSDTATRDPPLIMQVVLGLTFTSDTFEER